MKVYNKSEKIIRKNNIALFYNKKRQKYKLSEHVPAIKINNLSVFYNGKEALKDISLNVKSGKITGIIGPNGAGKSSLIKGVLELVDTSKNSNIEIWGKDLKSHRKKIAYVEQRNSLDLSFPIDVKNTVLLGTYPNLGYFKRPGKKEKNQAMKALEIVKMKEFANRQIGELSGGQLQRVFIARALAQKADIFLLDEPFIGIDAISEELIISLLKQLQKKGKTILIVHHDLHKVREYFDDVIIIDKHLIANGPVEAVFTTKNIQKAYGESMGDVLLKGA